VVAVVDRDVASLSAREIMLLCYVAARLMLYVYKTLIQFCYPSKGLWNWLHACWRTCAKDASTTNFFAKRKWL